MTTTTKATRTCRCGAVITKYPESTNAWEDATGDLWCADGQLHAPAIPACRTQDTICQWANEDGTLNVGEGDLAVWNGRMEQVDGILLRPDDPHRLLVFIAGHWMCVDCDRWTAVRRYIVEEEQ